MNKHAIVWFSDFNNKSLNVDFLKLSILSFIKSNSNSSIDSILCLCKNESVNDIESIKFFKDLGIARIIDITKYVKQYFPILSSLPFMGAHNWPIETHAKIIVPFIDELKDYSLILVVDPDVLIFKDLEKYCFLPNANDNHIMSIYQTFYETKAILYNGSYYNPMANCRTYIKEKYDVDVIAKYKDKNIIANCGVVLFNNSVEETQLDKYAKLANCYDKMLNDPALTKCFAFADLAFINMFIDFNLIEGGKIHMQSMSNSDLANIVFLHHVGTNRQLRLSYYNSIVKKYSLI